MIVIAPTSYKGTIAAGAAEIRSRQTRLDLAQAERIPDIKVELLYRRIQAEERDAFDLGISIPLPLFNRNQGRLREASAELAADHALTFRPNAASASTERVDPFSVAEEADIMAQLKGLGYIN